MSIADLLWDHANWIVAVASFYFAFTGILRGSIVWRPPGPIGYLWPRQYLRGAPATFMGFVFLGAGIVALFALPVGIVGFVGASLLTWFLGTFWPQRQ